MKYHDKKVIVFVPLICRFDVQDLWNGCFPLKGEGVKWNLLVMEVVKGLKCEFVCNGGCETVSRMYDGYTWRGRGGTESTGDRIV